eukprot:313499-Prymnesium_polylepis.1
MRSSTAIFVAAGSAAWRWRELEDGPKVRLGCTAATPAGHEHLQAIPIARKGLQPPGFVLNFRCQDSLALGVRAARAQIVHNVALEHAAEGKPEIMHTRLKEHNVVLAHEAFVLV